MGKVARAPGASTADLTSAPGETPDWMKDYKRIQTADRLDAETLRDHARKFRDKIQEGEDTEERLKEINKEITTFRFTKLPELFEKAELPSIEVAASGNSPGYSFRLSDHYYANISVEWPQAQRDAGFATVCKKGGEHLIKNEISILVGPGKGNDALAQRIIKGVERLKKEHPNADITIEETRRKIPWNTLTAWMKERVETGEEFTNEELDSIGGKIGKQVVPKEIRLTTKPPKR